MAANSTSTPLGLMVTGSFALMPGVNPQQVHAWYLAVYLDAVEWVELQVKNLTRLSDVQKQGVIERAAAIRRGEVGAAGSAQAGL